MNRGLVAALALLSCAAAPAPPTPVTIVQDIYTQLVSHNQSSNDAYEGPPDSLFAPRLQVLARASRRQAGDYEPCGLDYIFWSGGQSNDYEITDVDIQTLPSSGPAEAGVAAHFTGRGVAYEIDFTFKRLAGRWRLDEADQIVGVKHHLFSQALQCKD